MELELDSDLLPGTAIAYFMVIAAIWLLPNVEGLKLWHKIIISVVMFPICYLIVQKMSD